MLSAFWYLLRVQLLAHGIMRELPSTRSETELPSALSAQLSPLRHVGEVADLLQALHLYPCETPIEARRSDCAAPRTANVGDEGADHATRGAGRLRVLEADRGWDRRSRPTGARCADAVLRCMWRAGAAGRTWPPTTCAERSSARARHVTRQQRRCAILTI